MEVEDDEFGELYYDVLKPFYLLPSPNIENAGQNPIDENFETCLTDSADIRRLINDRGGLQGVEKSKEVVGTVRLEIYLGSRQVFENKFVFPVGGITQAEDDSGYNQSGNLVTEDGEKEMSSVRGGVNNSQCDPSENIVACEAGSDLNSDPENISDSSQCNLSERVGTVGVGDSNSNPRPGQKREGKASRTPESEINKRVEETSSVEMQDICTGIEPCKGEPSEEGQLSEYAELDSDRDMVIRAATTNSAEERTRYNENTRHVAPTFSRAVVLHKRTTSKPYRHQAKTIFRDISTSLFDTDLKSFEHKPWRRSGGDISDYFNFGFDEASWNSYCEKIKSTRKCMDKPIPLEHGVRDRLPSVKAIPHHQRGSTSAIQDKPSTFRQREQIQCYRKNPLEQNGEGLSGSQKGKQNTHQTSYAGMNMKREQANETWCHNHDMGSKRAKAIDEGSRESSSNMSENEWMCRHVGMDSWFRPLSLQEKHRNRQQETSGKGSRRGLSKLERWTRHDRDNDDENTSTSSLSSPLGFSRAGVAVELED